MWVYVNISGRTGRRETSRIPLTALMLRVTSFTVLQRALKGTLFDRSITRRTEGL